jgi:hypothetical protein
MPNFGDIPNNLNLGAGQVPAVNGAGSGFEAVTPGVGPNRFLTVFNTYDTQYRIGIAKGAYYNKMNVIDYDAIPIANSAYNQKDPWILRFNGVLYCYYASWENLPAPLSSFAGPVIRVAFSFNEGITWTNHSEPIIWATQTWEQDVDPLTNAIRWVQSPVVLYDETETDSSRRFKIWYSAGYYGKKGLGYSYMPDPLNQGVTSAQDAKVQLDIFGTSPAWDSTDFGGMHPGAVTKKDDTYYLWYGTAEGSGVAWTKTPGTNTSYVKGANNPTVEPDGITANITATVTVGATQVTVSSSSVFPDGCPVWVYDGAGNKYMAHVINRVSSTVIALDRAAPVSIGTSGGKVQSVLFSQVGVRGYFYNGSHILGIIGMLQGAGIGLREVNVLAVCTNPWDKVTYDYKSGHFYNFDVADTDGDNYSMENGCPIPIFEYEAKIGDQDALYSTSFSAKGDLIIGDSTARGYRLTVGGNGQFLTADSTQPGGIKWAASSASISIGQSVTGFTTNAILYTNSSGNLSSTSTFVYDSVNNRLGIGTASPEQSVHIAQSSAFSFIQMDVASSSSALHGPFIIFRKGRGTIASPSSVSQNDQVAGFFYRAYAGFSNSYLQRAGISANVDFYDGSSLGIDFRFATGRSSSTGGVTNTRLQITSHGHFALYNMDGSAPSTNLGTAATTGGGWLYADAGALRWRGGSGTVTTIAPA